MATKSPEKKKVPSPKEVCTRCRHPKPFHHSGPCRAFGCDCKSFTKRAKRTLST